MAWRNRGVIDRTGSFASSRASSSQFHFFRGLNSCGTDPAKRCLRLFDTFYAQRSAITCEISEVHFLIQCVAGGIQFLSLALYAYWAATIPMVRRSHRYAFGSLRPRQLDAMVMILLLANPVQGLDNAVRRQSKHASMDPFAAVRPPSPHTQPPDGDMTAKVAAESRGRGLRAVSCP